MRLMGCFVGGQIGMRNLTILGGLILLTVCANGAAHAQTVSGPARVITGSIVEIQGQQIRLQGIDAPDVLQGCRDSSGRFYKCGERSWVFLHRLIEGQTVRCTAPVLDSFVRKSGRCSVRGADLARAIVSQGHAVATAGGDRYLSAEAEARKNRRGLWSGSFVRPEEWRSRMKNPPVASRSLK